MKKILVVDDDDGILEAVSIILQAEGYEVSISKNGDAIKKLTAQSMPDLILLDVLLSGEDGRNLCKLVKNNEHMKHIPVIMFSADPNVKEGIAACKADDFLAKPFEIADLIGKIQEKIN